jgi:hypothetical protein
MWVATSLWAAPFSFTTGNPDGRLGALSRRASPGKLETETADDFILQQTTVCCPSDVTDDMVDLQIHLSQRLVHVLHVLRGCHN